jgi:hypothetical protein
VIELPDNIQKIVDLALADASLSDTHKAQLLGSYFLPMDAAFQVQKGVQEKIALGLTPADEDMEEQVQATLFKLKVQTEAERRLASESYAGSSELSWDDLAEATRSWLVQDLIPEDGTCFLVARSNMGKTFLYLDAVLRMAAGMPFLGKATRPAKTLIVLGEGRAGFMARIQSWLRAHGVSADAVRPYLSFIDRANLNNDESLARITEVAEREGVELVVFDTWAATSGIQKEEDNALNSATLNRVRDALPGRSLFFVHHPRKAEEDTDHPVMRGAGALQGSADVVMTLYRDPSYRPASGEAYEFLAVSTEAEHNGKNRDAQTETIRGLFLDEVELEDGDIGRVMNQVDSESISKEARKVRSVLLSKMSGAEFQLASGLTRATAYRYLSKAVEDGVAIKREMTQGPAVYEPTQAWSMLQGKAAEADAEKGWVSK